jgi:hypothetical protein
MAENIKKTDYGNELAAWSVPEYERHDRTKLWYIVATTITLLLLIFSFLSLNFLFAVIIIVAALVIIIHDGRKPDKIKISLTDLGIMVGKKFFEYDDLKNFAIINKPHRNINNLYFEFKTWLRPQLSIALDKTNPEAVRKNLLKYLPEDLERTAEPLTEALAKFFKL